MEAATEILQKNIMAALEKAGLKKANAAHLLKIDTSYFNRMLKNGRWQLDYLERLAKLLDVPLWKLFFPGYDLMTEKEEITPGMLAHPAETGPTFALDLSEYLEVPVVKFQVMLRGGTEAFLPKEKLAILYMKKELISGLSLGKTPSAVELGVMVD